MTITLLRTVLLYGLLIFTVRLMGKRQVAEMEPAEFVVTMLLANLASVPMQDNGLPLLSGIVPMFTILGLELMLAVLSLKLLPVRRLLCGVPALLIRDGKIDQRALALSRVSLDELSQKLREKDIFDYAQVAWAILETDGELTVMPRSQFQVVTREDLGLAKEDGGLYYHVISDGVVLPDNLRQLGLDRTWLKKQLADQGLRAKDVFLLAVNSQGSQRLVRKEKP